MNKAEKMREIAEKANAKKSVDHDKFYNDYVEKLINGKILKAARKGRTMIKHSISKRYFSVKISQELLDRGFKVTQVSNKNGRSTLTITW